MPRLKSANFAVSALTYGINNTATSFVVDDVSSFPDTGPFIILVHDMTPGFAGVKEIMEVGSINKGTNTLSDVLRGREGTTAVAHNAGNRVEVIFSAGTHQELADAEDLTNHVEATSVHSATSSATANRLIIRDAAGRAQVAAPAAAADIARKDTVDAAASIAGTNIRQTKCLIWMGVA